MSQKAPQLTHPFTKNHINEIYRLTGDGKNYQGFALACVNEDGKLVVITEFQNEVVKLALIALLQDYVDGQTTGVSNGNE